MSNVEYVGRVFSADKRSAASARSPSEDGPARARDASTSPHTVIRGESTFAASDQLRAYSVREFCDAHGISKAMFYVLAKNGEGPLVMKVGNRTLVSAEAAAEWRERMSARRGERRGRSV